MFVGMPEGERPLGRNGLILDNIKMDLKSRMELWTGFI
jgi:hypothetical protein